MIRPIVRSAALLLVLSAPAVAQNAEWEGPYGGLSLSPSEPRVGVFVGSLAERGPALLGAELDASVGDGARLSITGRLGAGLAGTLVYGLAGVEGGTSDGGEAGVVVGAGAERRLGGVRLGGELRHERIGEGDGEMRLGARIALEF